MGEKRQFEVLLVKLVPHALRDDFMTVGVVVLEDDQPMSGIGHEEGLANSEQTVGSQPVGDLPSAEGAGVSEQPAENGAPSSRNGHLQERSPSATSKGPIRRETRFADARFTRDLKRVECFAPDLEIEILERLEKEVRKRLGEIRGRGELLQLLEEEFGTVFDVGPAKGLVAEDPAAEMRVLERDYLAPVGASASVERARRQGRLGIVAKMQDAFAEAGVLEMLQRDLDMSQFTGENDPFRADFGFRVGTSLKMFHALALNMSREPAVALAYRFARIQSGMRSRNEKALMTAIVSEEALRLRGEVASGIAMLRANEVEVRGLGEMGEIAERVRRELRA